MNIIYKVKSIYPTYSLYSNLSWSYNLNFWLWILRNLLDATHLKNTRTSLKKFKKKTNFISTWQIVQATVLLMLLIMVMFIFMLLYPLWHLLCQCITLYQFFSYSPLHHISWSSPENDRVALYDVYLQVCKFLYFGNRFCLNKRSQCLNDLNMI